jgi:hypothetical protein
MKTVFYLVLTVILLYVAIKVFSLGSKTDFIQEYRQMEKKCNSTCKNAYKDCVDGELELLTIFKKVQICKCYFADAKVRRAILIKK